MYKHSCQWRFAQQILNLSLWRRDNIWADCPLRRFKFVQTADDTYETLMIKRVISEYSKYPF